MARAPGPVGEWRFAYLPCEVRPFTVRIVDAGRKRVLYRSTNKNC